MLLQQTALSLGRGLPWGTSSTVGCEGGGNIFCFSLAGCFGEGCNLRLSLLAWVSWCCFKSLWFLRGFKTLPLGWGAQGSLRACLWGLTQPSACLQPLPASRSPFNLLPARSSGGSLKKTPQNPHVLRILFYLDVLLLTAFLPYIHSACSFLDSSALVKHGLTRTSAGQAVENTRSGSPAGCEGPGASQMRLAGYKPAEHRGQCHANPLV